MSFRFKNNSDRNLSPDNLQLEIVDENLTVSSSSTVNLQPHPSSSSAMAAVVEHKETYVNMMYNNNATTGTSLSPGTVESPLEDDDDAEMMKNRTKKISSRAPFRFKQFSLMKKGSFKLTSSSSPPPTELTSSPTAEHYLPQADKSLTFERQKSTTSSTTGSTSRLKKLFMLSRADPSKKLQKDVSLNNFKHVL